MSKLGAQGRAVGTVEEETGSRKGSREIYS